MSFWKTSKVEIIGFKDTINSSLRRTASTHRLASSLGTPTMEKISELLLKVSENYKISEDPRNYVYVAVRALTADVPNENFDCFTEEELLRLDARQGCHVFETFILKPHHVEHRSEDMTQARGVIIDACYNDKNAEHFPELLIAVDKTKDKELAEGIQSGELTGWSMGCVASSTTCSICGNKAEAPVEFCKHIRFDKGQEIEGKLAFEYCEGVTFEEESSVGNPADKTAVTQEVIASKDDNTLMDISDKVDKLNTIVSELVTKVVSDVEKQVNVEVVDNMNIDPKNKKSIEQYSKEKEEEKEKDKSMEELGLENEQDAACTKEKKSSEDKNSVAPSITEANTRKNKKSNKKEICMKKSRKSIFKAKAKATRAKKVAKTVKKALDPAGKKYLEKVYGDYGKGMTKDVKRKTVGKHSLPKNNPKLNNPKPKKTKKAFRFKDLYKDVSLIDCSNGWSLVAKADAPLYIVKASKTNYKLLEDIATVGLVKTMKAHKAIKVTSMFTTGQDPSPTSNVETDLRDKDSTTKLVKGKEGIEAKGITDMKGGDFKQNTDKGTLDMKVTGSALRFAKHLGKKVTAKTSDIAIVKIAEKFIAGIDTGGDTDFAKTKIQTRTQPTTADGIIDTKDKAVDNSAEQTYSGGTDDMKDTRGNIIKIKTSTKKRSRNVKAEAEKIAVSLAADIIAEELPKEAKLFKKKYARAVKLAAKRAQVNLIDNALKIAISDTLVTATEDYPGMDDELAVCLVEDGYSKGSDEFIATLLDETDSFLDMEDEAFLALEKDANKINVVASSYFANDNFEDYEEDTLRKQAMDNNPVFVPKTSEDSGKWDKLAGLFSKGK